MNLINFHKFPKNEKFINEAKIQVVGQGLYDSYWWEIVGKDTRLNKYVFTVLFKNKEYKIYFDEMHIINWSIKSKYEEDKEIYDNIKFEGYGNFNNEGYYWFYSGDCDDYQNIFYGDKKLKILDITVELDQRKSYDIIKNLSNEMQFCDLMDIKYKEIDKIGKDYDLKNLNKIEFNEWIKNYEPDKKYYFNTTLNQIIPFQVKKLEKTSDNEYEIYASIYFDGFEHNVNIELIYYNFDEDYEDYHNISINFEIKTTLDNTKFEEDCCIME